MATHCLKHGVLFEGGQEVLLTESHWRLVAQYNLTQVEEESRNLSIMLNQVKGYYNNFFQNLLSSENITQFSAVLELETAFRYEYAVLQQDVSEYISEVADLGTLLAKKRSKRGLIDAGGHLLKFLFGTMDSNDLDVINEKVNYLYDTTNDIVHDTQEQITVFNNMHEAIANNSKTINQMVSKLKEYHSVLHSTLNKVFSRDRQVHAQVHNLLQYLKLTATLADVKDTIGSAIRKTTRLHQAIEDLAGGKVSSNLLSPHEYLSLLREVEKVIPTPAKLYLPVSLENVHQYYDIATVTSYTTGDTLRVILQVPLKLDSNLFHIYDVVSYPIFEERLGKWMKWEVEKQKVIISKDRQLYTIFGIEEFERDCHGRELVVCPLTNVLRRPDYYPSCPVELILGKVENSCNRKVIADQLSPVFVKTESRWLFSTSKEHKLTLNCYGIDGTVNVTSKVIMGIGVLSEIDKCDVITEGLRLPARIHGSSNYQLRQTELLIPDLSSIYTAEENGLLDEDWSVTSKVLEGLETELGSIGVEEYHLEGVFERLRTKRVFRAQTRGTAIAVGSIVFVLFGLMLAWFCCRKWPSMRAWYQRRRLRHQGKRIGRLANLLTVLSSGDLTTESQTSTGADEGAQINTLAPEQPGEKPVATERSLEGKMDPYKKYLTVDTRP